MRSITAAEQPNPDSNYKTFTNSGTAHRNDSANGIHPMNCNEKLPHQKETTLCFVFLIFTRVGYSVIIGTRRQFGAIPASIP